MKRALLLLLLPLALAACSPDLSPEAARDLAAEAEASGDARGALRAYKAAAKGGDLEALNIIANAYRDGYVRAQTTSASDGATFLPIMTWPGQGDRWQARYSRERDDAARSGDPAAWMRVADDLTVWNREETTADRDSAKAIRQRLVDEGYHGALLHTAFQMMRDDRERAIALLVRAEAAGSPQACHVRQMFERAGTSIVTASQWSDEIDRLESCPALGTTRPYGAAKVIGNLREAEARGESNATAHLDSLRALGVFERHPHLDQI